MPPPPRRTDPVFDTSDVTFSTIYQRISFPDNWDDHRRAEVRRFLALDRRPGMAARVRETAVPVMVRLLNKVASSPVNPPWCVPTEYWATQDRGSRGDRAPIGRRRINRDNQTTQCGDCANTSEVEREKGRTPLCWTVQYVDESLDLTRNRPASVSSAGSRGRGRGPGRPPGRSRGRGASSARRSSSAIAPLRPEETATSGRFRWRLIERPPATSNTTERVGGGDEGGAAGGGTGGEEGEEGGATGGAAGGERGAESEAAGGEEGGGDGGGEGGEEWEQFW